MNERRGQETPFDPSLPAYQARAHVEAMIRSSLPLESIHRDLRHYHEMFRASGMEEDRRVWWDNFVSCAEEVLENHGLEIAEDDRLSKNPLISPET